MSRKTDEFIAQAAEMIRQFLDLYPDTALSVAVLVSKYESAKNPKTRITFIEESRGYLRGAKARAEPKRRRVYYQQGLRKLLELGDKLAASIFLEEIGHVVLNHDAPVMDHAIGMNVRFNARPALRDMEDEAERFCWYMKAPISEVYNVSSPTKLIEKFLMSPQEAQKYFEHIVETRNRIEGRAKSPLTRVIDLQAERATRSITIGSPKLRGEEDQEPKPVSPMSQYAGFSPVPCRNCGFMTVAIRSGCEYCTNCGEEYGCS